MMLLKQNNEENYIEGKETQCHQTYIP